MRSATRSLAILAAAGAIVALCGAVQPLRERLLREYAIRSGLVPVERTWVPVDPAKAAVGAKLFQDTGLSMDGTISCQSCHLDRFSSADGLPVAVGVGGRGEGAARMAGGGDIVPRNVMALWGRGGRGFDTFFYDGKVQRTGGRIVSQFGAAPPSADPLVVAAHLPFVEIREMVANHDDMKERYAQEAVGSANRIYDLLSSRLRRDPVLGPELSRAYHVPVSQLRFGQAADAIASFIRVRFRLRSTRFHDYVFHEGALTPAEERGGLLFYGKGRCSSCHDGPYFSDFGFHAVAFPQLGFGKNGFGVDYGRYNVTFDPKDRYRFRTPPLYNVTRTAPYSHSGSVSSLPVAVAYHFDPLRFYRAAGTTGAARLEELRRMGAAANEPLPEALTDDEVRDVVAFLGTLSFDAPVTR